MKPNPQAPALALASLLPAAASAQGAGAAARPAVIYTQFEPRPANTWTEPSAAVGSVAYNEWLGHMFNGVLCNTKDAAEQRRIAERIVDVDYIQHNRRNGRLYEHWDQFDWPRVFVQLGVRDLPAPFYGVASQPYSR